MNTDSYGIGIDEDTESEDETQYEDKEIDEVKPSVDNLEVDTDEEEDEDPVEIEKFFTEPVTDIEEDVLIEVEKNNNEEILRMIQDPNLSEAQKEYMINELAIKNIKTVYYVVNKFARYNNNSSQDDMISAGMYGYAMAIKRFDPNRGAKFSTFAINCIRNAVRYQRRKENKYTYNHISMNVVKYQDRNGGEITLEDVLPDKKPTPEEHNRSQGLRKMLLGILNTLSPIEKYIITYRFGLDREIILTQKRIAEQVDMSQANVSKIERGCMDKIREMYSHDLNR